MLHFCKLRIIGKNVGVAGQYLELDISGRDRKAVRQEDLKFDPPNFKGLPINAILLYRSLLWLAVK
jgi:hypothetical protein